MKTATLDGVLANHKLWLLDSTQGVYANLHDADLRGANLCGADLRGANLCGANLCGANLCGADLRNVNLCGADLRDVNLCGADLSDVSLRGANLCGVDLRNVNLRGVDLRGANLRNANLCSANLYAANLDNASLTAVQLHHTIGDNVYVITMQLSQWCVTRTHTVMQIGCQRHTIEEWFTFDDDTINKMDFNALSWWRTYKPLIQLWIQLHPAKQPTEVQP
jgi:hypothetical protein